MIFFVRNFFLNPIILATVALLLFSCNEKKDEIKNSENSASSPWLNHNASARYVGKQTCRLCHENIYNTFMETGMGRSIGSALSKNSAADFSHPVIHDFTRNYSYQAFRKKDTIYILEFRMEGKDTVHKRLEKVDFIIGSGQHTNSHLINTNGYLNQAPMTFYTQKGKWDMPPGFENGKNSRFSRLIGLECMSCHNAFPEFVTGSENKFSSVPSGIDCERCHGPGSIHVQQKSNQQLVDTSKEIDYSIVNPAKLPIERQFDVCMRCHLQGNAILANGKSWFDFKPGMKLNEYISVFLPRYSNSENDFIMASHADRLKQSKCFVESLKQSASKKNSLRPFKDALTCVTCHNPHISVRKKSNENFNSACSNCHSLGKQPVCTDNAIELKKNKNNCISCHMPKSGSSDIPHVSIHDHYIRKKISNEGQKKLREFLGLKSINNPNPDSTTIAKAYINHFEKFDPQIRFLDSAKKYLGQITDSEKFHAFVQLLFNQKDFEGIKNKIIFIGTDSVLKKLTNSENIENNAAWTCYRAAEAFLSSGNVKIAKLFLEQSVQLAPYHLEFRNKLGVCEMHLGNKSSARKLFTSIIMDYPKDAKAFTNLGYLDALDNDFISAENNYQTALRIDPDNIKALLNFGGMQILKNKFPEGGSLLITALKIENGNKRTQQMIFALFQQLKISGRHKEFELLFTKLKKAVPSSSLLKELNQIK